MQPVRARKEVEGGIDELPALLQPSLPPPSLAAALAIQERTLAAAGELDPDLLVNILAKVEDGLALGLVGPGRTAAATAASRRAASSAGRLASALRFGPVQREASAFA